MLTKKRNRAEYAGFMLTHRLLPLHAVFLLVAIAHAAPAQHARKHAKAEATWTFAVSGDSRNCGDFVMPAIAARVQAEKDAFYWHLGDFRWMSHPDQDLLAMQPAGATLEESAYRQMAWDDFLTHQIATFGSFPVFIGRGNHETVPPMTRAGYVEKFSALLSRPEILAQNKADGSYAAPLGPWYHWTRDGVDFITMDNSSKDEFTDEQMRWLHAVLQHDLAPHSGIRAIVAGMHEALPHSTGKEHAMDDWQRGEDTGDQVYEWMYEAQQKGMHVYLIASHSHYYSPDIYDTAYWNERGKPVVPGLIIGSAGAHRYKIPATAKPGAKTMIYGYVQGTVHPDGVIDFALRELGEAELMKVKWPNAPDAAVHECYVHNGEGQ